VFYWVSTIGIYLLLSKKWAKNNFATYKGMPLAQNTNAPSGSARLSTRRRLTGINIEIIIRKSFYSLANIKYN
jgi:hypothetical protein